MKRHIYYTPFNNLMFFSFFIGILCLAISNACAHVETQTEHCVVAISLAIKLKSSVNIDRLLERFELQSCQQHTERKAIKKKEKKKREARE